MPKAIGNVTLLRAVIWVQLTLLIALTVMVATGRGLVRYQQAQVKRLRAELRAEQAKGKNLVVPPHSLNTGLGLWRPLPSTQEGENARRDYVPVATVPHGAPMDCAEVALQKAGIEWGGSRAGKSCVILVWPSQSKAAKATLRGDSVEHGYGVTFWDEDKE